MALNIYTKKDLIPKGMLFINANDPFFNANTELGTDELTMNNQGVVSSVIATTHLSILGVLAEYTKSL